MPEAVIVSTARSPIGRAAKGSLVDDAARRPGRADGRARHWTRCPRWTRATSTTSSWAAASPPARPGYNIGRAVAVELGYDFLPGTTVNRYCSSSLQTTRMAFHAIKAGEGDVFISAGVETVSRFSEGQRRRLAGLARTRSSPRRRHARPGRGRAATRMARPARGRPAARRLHRDGPDRRERGAVDRHQPRGPGPLGRAQPEPGRGGHQERLLRARDRRR